MAWFKREPKRDLVEVLAEAFGKALERSFDQSTKMIETNLRFLDGIQAINSKQAARALGSRGGRKSAERRAAAKKGAVPSCPLCADRMAWPLSIAQIQAHQLHGSPAPAASQNGTAEAPESHQEP